MFGLRYHIVTVVSMLLMLGIGFLFGATSGFGPNIVKSQTKTLSKLNGTLTSMVQDSQHDQDVMRQDQNALAQLTPTLVSGKLARKRIALVLLGDYPAAGQAAAQAISAAGGTRRLHDDRQQQVRTARRCQATPIGGRGRGPGYALP